jgi:hypothetical protein
MTTPRARSPRQGDMLVRAHQHQVALAQFARPAFPDHHVHTNPHTTS